MNCIRFVHIKDVFLLFHQNENGRKELCKWKKFCESILFTSTELDLWWGNHVMQNENKTTCVKWVSTRTAKKSEEKALFCCQSKLEAKWCEENVCERCAFIYRCKWHREYVLLSQSKLATCVHFISFYLWFGGVFEWMLLREKNIFISWFKWISTKWFNVAHDICIRIWTR